MDIGASRVEHDQAAHLIQRGDGPLDYPAVTPQALGGVHLRPGNPALDAPLAQDLLITARAVALCRRAASWAGSAGGNAAHEPRDSATPTKASVYVSIPRERPPYRRAQRTRDYGRARRVVRRLGGSGGASPPWRRTYPRSPAPRARSEHPDHLGLQQKEGRGCCQDLTLCAKLLVLLAQSLQLLTFRTAHIKSDAR